MADTSISALRSLADDDLFVELLEACHRIPEPRAWVGAALGPLGLGTPSEAGDPREVTHVGNIIALAAEVGRRAAAVAASRRPILGPHDVSGVASHELAGADRERLLVLVCDAGNRLRRATVITEGTADRLLIPVREVLALVLQHGGRAFAVAHNHPSGDTTPSSSDIEGTRALSTAAKTVGLRFLGHVIVADGRWQAVGSAEVRERGVDG